MSTDIELDKLELFLEQDLLVSKMKIHYRYDWKRAAWITWTTPWYEIVRSVSGEVEQYDKQAEPDKYDIANGKLVIDGSIICTLYEHHNKGLGMRLKDIKWLWETPSFNIAKAWVKPTYKIIKNKAWRTKKFDEYQLEVLFKGHSIMVDYEMAKTDGLLKAVEKAGKEATGSMKELLRELWLVVKPYRDAAVAKEQAAEDVKPVERVKEPFTYKDTVKGIMYAVTFRGQTVYIVKAVVLKHGWKKAIEHAAGQSSSEQYKELLRGLWRAV